MQSLADRARKYGIDVEGLQSLIDQSEGLCDLCRRPFAEVQNRSFHVDHDHRCCAGPFSCGRCIRGLLCTHCNNKLVWVEGLGLARLAAYLGADDLE